MRPEAEPTFERWLATVIHGLPPEVAAGVVVELTAHYEDAVAGHREQGQTLASAQATALADLGDPQVVRRQLQRVHLSRGERLRAWATQVAYLVWQRRAIIGTGLFGLAALAVVVSDHRHWISYRGHLDSITPLALILVVASLVLEHRLALWSYPAVGYLLSGISPWLLFTFSDAYGGLFWDVVAPLLLPVVALVGLAVAGLRQLRHRGPRRYPAAIWLILVLMIIAPLAMTGIQLQDGGVSFRPEALSRAELTVNAPWVLYMTTMLLAPVAAGLLGARRHGVGAALIPLACHYSLYVGIVDPTYHLTFYEYWQPSRTLHAIEAFLIYLPALTTFLVTPLWLLRARTTRGRIAAVLLPTTAVLGATPILSAIGLQNTWGAYTAATWVSAAIEIMLFILPLALALVLYSQFPGPILGPHGSGPADSVEVVERSPRDHTPSMLARSP